MEKFFGGERFTREEIIETAKKAVDLGFKTIVLQSGEDMYFDEKVMCEIISAIKKYDVALTLSIGERTYKEYKAFKLQNAINKYGIDNLKDIIGGVK